MIKNIFVAGLDDFHLTQLLSLKKAAGYRFHSLISYEKIKCGETFPVREFIQQAQKIVQEFNGSIDAIVGFWDFPVSTTLPHIRTFAGLDGPDLLSVLKCEHKYWSRLLQAEVVPELIPRFCVVDPFNKNAVEQCHLDYPLWLKPVKSVLSHLGFLVGNDKEFADCLQIIRGKISRYAEPFNFILDLAELPDEIRKIDGYHCIAEELISHGRQCTLEGYVQNGSVYVYGVIDSIREGLHESCFSRYQYPSTLPREVRQRMTEVTIKVLEHMRYDNAPFNIEFYWDENTDAIHLLEINTRISKSHCPLFKMVDGEYHHDVMIDVALGKKPQFPHRKGKFATAAKFMLRKFSQGKVYAIPQPQDIREVQKLFPGTEIIINVDSGMLLSELKDQDSYSFEICDLYMGAGSNDELVENYHKALSMLPFNIEQDGNTQ
jgi:hypothetical protein